jgi:hypothetical protein
MARAYHADGSRANRRTFTSLRERGEVDPKRSEGRVRGTLGTSSSLKEPLTRPSQSKADVSDFGQLGIGPKSGKPDFGWKRGEGEQPPGARRMGARATNTDGMTAFSFLVRSLIVRSPPNDGQ